MRHGEVRLYNGKNLVDSFNAGDIIQGVCFGTFGREDGCLLLNTKKGALSVRILQRQARLDISALKPGPPPE